MRGEGGTPSEIKLTVVLVLESIMVSSHTEKRRREKGSLSEKTKLTAHSEHRFPEVYRKPLFGV